MTDAQRQARYRAAHATGKPVIRVRLPADHRSLAQRWRDAVAELTTFQDHYSAWLDNMPSGLRDGPTAEAAQAICDLELGDIQAIEPPKGFGKD